jgi:predicted nucleic-acid-binding Zn-ribbon protein
LFNLPKCPKCSGTVENTDERLPVGKFMIMCIGTEMLMYLAAGLLLLVGLQWPPALILGGVFAFWLVFIRGRNRFKCKSCGAQFKYTELYTIKDS